MWVQVYIFQLGHRLGSDVTPSAVIPDSTPRELEPVSRLLTFWKNGFSVEDGPLLRYDDPQNQEMLNAIKSGRAPTSLLNVSSNQPVEVKVAQRMEEDYIEPPKTLKSFSGSGNRLGSIVTAPGPSSSIPGSFPTSANPKYHKLTIA